MNIIESLLTKKLEDFPKVYSDIKFILFAFSLISILGFLIIYSFLYGYYFSGDILFKISNFNIISNFIPFDLRTLSMTSFYFICIFYIISGSISVFKNESKKNKKKMAAFLFLPVAVVLNIMLTSFFASDLTPKSMRSFSLLWLFIGSIIWFLFIMIKIIQKPMVFVKGSILTFCIWLILSIPLRELVFNQEFLQQLLSTIILVVLWLLITTLFILFKDKTWMIFLSYSPISLIILMVLSNFLRPIYINNVFLITFLIVIAILFINIIIYKALQLFKKRLKLRNKVLEGEASKQDTENMEIREDIPIESKFNNEKGILYNTLFILYRVIVYKKNHVMKLILGIMLLLVFVFTPQISMFCGKGIRTLNTSDEFRLEILYVNQNNVKEEIFANYYIENNSVLYISNENWELEVIKPINYHIRPYKLNEE